MNRKPLNRIRELRKQRGMTQANLAKILQVSDRAVGFYETGDRDPDTETLIILSDFFGVSVDYLLGHSNIRDFDYKQKSKSIIVDFGDELPLEAKDDFKILEEFIRYKYRKK